MKRSQSIWMAALVFGSLFVIESNVEGKDKFHVPPGHLPPAGQCRVWFPDRPPGHQPPPGDCRTLSRRVPRGALLIARDRRWTYDELRRGRYAHSRFDRYRAVNRENRRDREIRQDIREVRKARAEVQRNRQRLENQREELKQDRAELRDDIREGAGKREIRRDRHAIRKDREKIADTREDLRESRERLEAAREELRDDLRDR